ncbi:hypothetical protein SAE02_61560 [Skermanella aerolata]|uniref:Uncharacterized protein n=1 Tax=Skermanella aerolata TaxID=393310 RepID=A0A512DZU3_9PROT|nr:hypothetical protein N826_25550 [Skermanella aerolata KACC 11604]GEO42008.1 hypothetical protein SAE02_61560 [Skermanella aerolata]
MHSPLSERFPGVAFESVVCMAGGARFSGPVPPRVMTIAQLVEHARRSAKTGSRAVDLAWAVIGKEPRNGHKAERREHRTRYGY